MKQQFFCPHCGASCDLIIPVIDSAGLINHAMAMTEISIVLNSLEAVPDSRVPSEALRHITAAREALEAAAAALREADQ